MRENIASTSLQSDFCFTKTLQYGRIGVLKMFCRGIAANNPRRATNLLRRLVTMDTLPPHDQEGNTLPETTFIYVLIDPETKLVRYVGKANNPQDRLSHHIRGCRQSKTQKNSWIISLLNKKLSPLLEIIEEVSISGWQERECYWIKRYRDEGYPLTNGTDGGDGNHGLSEDARAKMSAANKGKKLSPKTRAKMGKTRRGVKRPPHVMEKLRSANLGRKLSPEHIANISASHKGKAPSPQARAAITEKVKGKPVPPEILGKKRATIAARKLAGAYDKPRKPIPGEAIARRNATNRTRFQQKREVNPRSYNETEASFAIFVEYCEMGSERSLAKLAAKRSVEGRSIGVTVSALKNFSSKYHWRERVVEYDQLEREGHA